MGILNSNVYDLTTPDGQLQALQDIVDEQNNQYDRSVSTQGYNVVAYSHLVVDLINGSPTGVYKATYVHGQGFAPVFLPFLIVAGPNTWAPNGYVETNFAPSGPLNDYAYFTCDAQNIYFNVFARNIGGIFSTTHWEGGIYVLDIPLNI
jgi:hypothetical protein